MLIASGWYWCGWFAIFGAGMLLIMQSRYAARQVTIERAFQARSFVQQEAQRTSTVPQGKGPPPDYYSTETELEITITPLIGFLLGGGVLLISVGVFRAFSDGSQAKNEPLARGKQP